MKSRRSVSPTMVGPNLPMAKYASLDSGIEAAAPQKYQLNTNVNTTKEIT
ncbi:TPA: hypothetical protein HA344_07785 [Candidatus Bathyarchaeota archaeon]|nr:hypothetical protein [Candidatus Bathyarchaeota archaeon]